jgi:predicted nucleotidyltransferase
VHAELEAALTAREASLFGILRAAREVVLFGSRAFGCADPSSDWDLLLVDSTDAPRVRGFDLIRVSGERSRERTVWHASELATHVALCGLWLKGEPPARWDFDFRAAAERKRHVLEVRLRAIAPAWNRLSMPRKCKQFAMVRRDLQRLVRLMREQSIPPRQVLDAEWAQADAREDWAGAMPNEMARLQAWEVEVRGAARRGSEDPLATLVG